MQRGYFKVWRKIEDNPIWDSLEPHNKRSAWIELLRITSWRERDYQLGDNIFHLEPGQIMVSLRFLAQKFRWSVGRVRKYLKLLETLQQIGTKQAKFGTLITICNWETYQGSEHTNKHDYEHAKKTQTDKIKAQNKEVIKKGKEVKKDTPAPSAVSSNQQTVEKFISKDTIFGTGRKDGQFRQEVKDVILYYAGRVQNDWGIEIPDEEKFVDKFFPIVQSLMAWGLPYKPKNPTARGSPTPKSKMLKLIDCMSKPRDLVAELVDAVKRQPVYLP